MEVILISIGIVLGYVRTMREFKVQEAYSLPARLAYAYITAKASMRGIPYSVVGSWVSGLATHAKSDLDFIIPIDLDGMSADQLFEVSKQVESVFPVRFKKLIPQCDGAVCMKFNSTCILGVDADVVVRRPCSYVTTRIGSLPDTTVRTLRAIKRAHEAAGTAKEYKSRLSRFAAGL